MTNPQVICFGEILWDVFPNEKVIGGAPLNVALRLSSLGMDTAMVSCVGMDALGDRAVRYCKENGVQTNWIASHRELRTGEVLVHLDSNGSATYTITEPVAWDAIPPAPEVLEAVRKAPFFIFGSLALRNAFNRNTLQALLPHCGLKIFDANLRPPFYDLSLIYELMQLADVVKLNDGELKEICDGLGCQEKGLKEQLRWLEKVTQTATICITLGSEGACLLTEGQLYRDPGYPIQVVDTVGAGDSFLAMLVSELLIHKNDPQVSLARACAMGAAVASKNGANCHVTSSELQEMLAR